MVGLVVAAYAIGYFHTGTLLGMGECVAHNGISVLASKIGAIPAFVPASISASHHHIASRNPSDHRHILIPPLEQTVAC